MKGMVVAVVVRLAPWSRRNYYQICILIWSTLSGNIGLMQRILEVEHGTFTPLVFSIQGGMSPECAKFYSRLATLISEKRNDNKNTVTSWMRCRLNFSLLRSALLCIRGSRTIAYMQDTREQNFDLSVSQARIK